MYLITVTRLHLQEAMRLICMCVTFNIPAIAGGALRNLLLRFDFNRDTRFVLQVQGFRLFQP